MNNEIKEIELDHFNSIKELKQNVETWIKEGDMYWERWFSLYDLKTLLDYITKLQEENEKLKYEKNETIEYIENDMPYLEEPDEEIERCDGTTYMTMKEYDASILLNKLKGEENDNFNKNNESN